MNLAFFTKFLADVLNQVQVLLKHPCTLGKLVNADKGNYVAINREKKYLYQLRFLMALSIFLLQHIV